MYIMLFNNKLNIVITAVQAEKHAPGHTIIQKLL